MRMSIASSTESVGALLTSTAAAATEGGGGAQSDTPHLATPTAELSLLEPELALPPREVATDEPVRATEPIIAPEAQLPLHGLKVVIIHIKEKLRDGPPAGEIILDQLRGHEERNPLGCEYIISHAGQSLYF
jgi:3',5'-cyclic-nucleotide phosphodiesterase